MIDRDSTQSAPPAPPYYELLSHPLVHYPDSPSYTRLSGYSAQCRTYVGFTPAFEPG